MHKTITKIILIKNEIIICTEMIPCMCKEWTPTTIPVSSYFHVLFSSVSLREQRLRSGTTGLL